MSLVMSEFVPFDQNVRICKVKIRIFNDATEWDNWRFLWIRGVNRAF